MARPISLAGMTILLTIFIGAGAMADGPAQGKTPGLTITEAGKSSAGRQLYNLKADGAYVVDVLKQLFAKAGINNYQISAEVTGSVTLDVQGVSADSLIDQVRSAMVPPLYIQSNGRQIFVMRSANAVSKAEEIRRRMEAMQGGRLAPGIVPNGLTSGLEGAYRDSAALEKTVTLNVSDEHPITLSAALQLLESQTRVPIRLDPSLTGDVKFTGTVTRVPLRTVLQNIAPGGEGSLKWISTPSQILIAPADRMNVVWNGSAIGSNQACQKCKQLLLSTWNFCPNCGQPTRRGQAQGYQGVPSIRGKGPQRPE